MNQTSYHILVQKLDEFIRKYYVNQLIRGSLHSVALLCVLWISFVLLEYYVFNASVSSIAFRKTLFYTFSFTLISALSFWIGIPAIQYFKLGKIISHEQAAHIIGNHFTNVKDKLLNLLQLRAVSQNDQSALLLAAIDQKTIELEPVPFKKAIDLRENKKYLRFALPPLFLFLVLLLSSNIIQTSTQRIIENGKEFEKEAPFAFNPKNLDKKIVQFDDFTLEVEVIDKGALPNEAYIEIENFRYKMEKLSATKYRYLFNKIQKDAKFRLSASGFSSISYTVDVIEKPSVAQLSIEIQFPAYIGRKNEKLSNVGDLAVPVGSRVVWNIESQHTEKIDFLFPGESQRTKAALIDQNRFQIEKKLKEEGIYKVFVSNNQVSNADSISYALTLIPDLYPTIELEKFEDSTDQRIVFLAGEVSDDYGLRILQIHYSIEREGKNIPTEPIRIPIQGGKQSTYEYMLNIRNFNLLPGDRFSYYLQVWDNDGVNGSKSTRTQTSYYQLPTLEQVEKQEEKNNEQIKSDLEQAKNEVEKLQKALKKAQEGALQKSELNWQDRREIEKLLEQQKAAEQKIKEAQENFKENLKNQEDFQKVDEEILKKQEMLEKLFEQVMSEEMKELFEKLEEMLDDLNKDQVLEQMKQMEMNDEKLKKELDRMINLFKKMEVEKEMEDAINQLDSLAKEQEELSKETAKEENNQNPEKQKELEEKQKEINQKFEKINEKIDNALKKNQEMEQPMDLDDKDLNQQEKEIQEEQNDASEQIQKKQNKSASKSQKNASEKMKKMSQAMQKMMNMQQMQQMQQDLKVMRQIMENLLEMSFEQEKLIGDINKTMQNTPMYVELVRKQFKLKDDFKIIEDSLNVLAKRMFQIQSIVSEKVAETKKSLKKSIDYLEERQKREGMVQQQYVMTYVNELALLLSEAMNQTQQQMAQQMQGQQMCEKPGENEGEGQGEGNGKNGKKPGMGGLKNMQQELNKQIEQMQQQMKNGKNPSSKDFAQMAAKQAAIRKALQDMKREQQQKGKGGGKELQDIIDNMNKTETDLVNKRLPNDINKRQQEIMTRLLESDKAQREREYDEKRKSEQPDQNEKKIPAAMEEYLKKRKGSLENFKTIAPNLKPFYKNLVEEYLRELK